MCSVLNRSHLLTAVAAAAVLACAALPAAAADSAGSATFTVGNTSPTYGAMTLGVSPVTGRPLSGMGSGIGTFLQTLDFGARMSSPVNVGAIGLFGGFNSRPSVLTLMPSTGWNFGASVGYAGFYVRGGVNEQAPVGPLLGIQGLQAGFGYEIGALDFRVSYLTAQTVGLTAQRESENRQFSLGGIYQISPRVRVNADAFYGLDGTRSGAPLAVVAPQGAPQGTGARVGVELRF